ncbi:MAG: iron-sulfur cluster assembly protein [Candidatus Bathyarchaeia archaeon]
MSDLKDKVREALGKVQDPETGLTFGQMKMITSLEESEPGVFNLDLVPTSFFCPVVFKLAADVEAAALSVKGPEKSPRPLSRSHDVRSHQRNRQSVGPSFFGEGLFPFSRMIMAKEG